MTFNEVKWNFKLHQTDNISTFFLRSRRGKYVFFKQYFDLIFVKSIANNQLNKTLFSLHRKKVINPILRIAPADIMKFQDLVGFGSWPRY